MKKVIAVLLVFVLMFGLCGCVASGENTELAVKFFTDKLLYSSYEEYEYNRDDSTAECREKLLGLLHYHSKDWNDNYGEEELQQLLDSKKFGKEILKYCKAEAVEAVEKSESENANFDDYYTERISWMVTKLEKAGAENETVRNAFFAGLDKSVPSEKDAKSDIKKLVRFTWHTCYRTGTFYEYPYSDTILDCICYDIKSDDFRLRDKLDLISYLESRETKYDKVKEAVENSIEKPDFSKMTNQEFFDYMETMCGEENLNYYVQLAKALPYNEVAALAKERGDVLTTAEDKGYYGAAGSSKSSHVTDPLGTGYGGVGTYTTTRQLTPYGDFAYVSTSKRWYGSDSDDPNNSSDSYWLVYAGEEERTVHPGDIVDDSNGAPIYALMGDDSNYSLITFGDNEMYFYNDGQAYLHINYQTGEYTVK